MSPVRWIVALIAHGRRFVVGTLLLVLFGSEQPRVDITPTFSGGSYWLFGKDGGVFAYGGAPYEGSLPGQGVHVTDIVGSAAL